ncbi:hypothetical protein EWM58_03380 [Candidatus Erwinia dacicola]|nr:hypothetical protein [Candidatus Erwinia dacicola]
MNPFKGRHFERHIILWAVCWYCKYGISYRELQEMLAERGVNVDHTTIYRWVQRSAPEMEKRRRWYWRQLSGFGSWHLDETPDIIADGDGWLVKGGTDLHSLQQLLDTQELVKPEDDHASLAGLLIDQKGQLPKAGEVIEMLPLCFQIIEATDYRIDLVRVTKERQKDEEE